MPDRLRAAIAGAGIGAAHAAGCEPRPELFEIALTDVLLPPAPDHPTCRGWL